METKSSACPLDCPDLCGLSVTVEHGRVIAVDGDHRSSFTNGLICGKVRKIADHLYGPDRVLHPMVRKGPKGSGVWERLSWDAALDVITSKLELIRTRHGGEGILPFHYGGSNGWLTDGALAERFWRRMRTSKLVKTYCSAAATEASRGLYGKMPGVALEDYEHANLIVLWGINPSATGIHLVPVLNRARARGAKLVVIDPRATPLAHQADLYLPIRPGADLPVALAVIAALFDRGYADEQFLAEHCDHADELRRRAAVWTISRAAKEAHLDPAALDQFVELYAASSPAVIRPGYGVERNRNGGSAIAAVLAISAIANKFGVRGGGFTMANSDASWTVNAETAIGAEPQVARAVNQCGVAGALETLRDPPIECLFVYNANPAATAPDQRALIEQLRREDLFVVVHEQVMTDTAQLADIVLPATTFLEHRELRRGYGNMRMYDSPAVATPAGESRSNNQLFGELLRRFGLVEAGDAMTDQELVDATFAAGPHGPELARQLAERGIATPANATHPIMFVDTFPPGGKIQLVPVTLDRDALGGLYVYKPDPGSAEFPLALISPALATQISSTFGQLRHAPGEIEIATADAAARGIKTGDTVRAWNPTGEVLCLAKVTGDVREGVCVLAKGLWRKHTANGYTSNALIPASYADLGGQGAFNDARIQIEKA
ncbi:MAG TPA: molybdopterin-dependent oxidoreductase [Kofleriaceae bacterium]|nr:molybdopterin-dependent oxidoreductase [Kofleriaceae bacterium]